MRIDVVMTGGIATASFDVETTAEAGKLLRELRQAADLLGLTHRSVAEGRWAMRGGDERIYESNWPVKGKRLEIEIPRSAARLMDPSSALWAPVDAMESSRISLQVQCPGFEDEEGKADAEKTGYVPAITLDEGDEDGSGE